ncbi:MAG: Mrp/NBP35 family ATP-binding protein [Methylacidiphilales bacterium]|nr:Mrp/NBP35 family ATP-binding protein [Candidatus Methylacidiphilales bacterium]MDW8349887.1 Mrp/NBP35 family ATP-binding protein [Verrucomicrobiae bacterium]
MPTISREMVLEALRKVKYPGFSRDIVSFGIVKDIYIDGSRVGVGIIVRTENMDVPQAIYEAVMQAVQGIEGVTEVDVKVDVERINPIGGSGRSSPEGIRGVRYIIAVASGKGGVGKSTVAANLAVGLQKVGFEVGLCDCDIYGPSMGLMFGATDVEPLVDEEDRLVPVVAHGVRVMSMGFFLGDSSPAVLRGPMVTRYTQQFLQQVAWGNLDVLILDLPPGTGDIALTIVQTVALSGAVVVTTPQEVALIDARKACEMFKKVNVPVLGLIENMSYFVCPNDGNRYFIFGEGGGKREAERMGVPLLAEVPIELEVRESGDDGIPVVLRNELSDGAKAFMRAVNKVAELLITTMK